MVTVSFYYQEHKIMKVEVEGHANFAQVGKDIVCAGISAVVFGALNALDKLVKHEEITIHQTDAKITIEVLKPTTNNQMILQTMLWQLKTISAQYQKNLIIKETY